MGDKLKIFCISATTGYVESTSTASMWFQFNSVLPYEKAIAEFIKILRLLVEERLNANEKQPSECCKRALAENPPKKFCAICGTKLASFNKIEYESDDIVEAYHELFNPNDGIVDHDVYSELEDHNINMGFTRMEPNEKHILVFINGIDYMVAGDDSHSEIGEVFEIKPKPIKVRE